MIKPLSTLFLAALIPALATAKPVVAPKIAHVIYITLDGTRWQDVFIDKRLPIFWKKYASKGTWYGMPGSDRIINVASIPVSMPSYQSQTSGKVQPCDGNDCARVAVKTMQEKLVDKFNKKAVATFASWHLIANAVESKHGVSYSNTGNVPVLDPDTNTADPVMHRLNALQKQNPGPEHDRMDKYTYAQALHYFRTYQPRFMWISLTEADEAAHADNKKAYRGMFKLYDLMLDQVFTMVNKMKLIKNTMIIVTTDHGRGNGKYWTSHGPRIAGSKRTWAFVYNGELQPIGRDGNTYKYSTLSIRPTIESALIK